MFNAPWLVLVLIGALLAAYGLQTLIGPDALAAQFGVSGEALRAGRYGVLISSLFLHQGWPHVLLNAVFALAFATPVVRRMGPSAQASVLFIIFYLVCGMVSGAAFALNHWSDGEIAVGASGALAGCMGAASRLMGPGPGLARFTSRPVLAMAASWVAINGLFGLVLVGWTPGAGGAPIAWEAHLAGYAAGLVLIGPCLSLLGRV